MITFYQDFNKENILDYNEYFNFTQSTIKFLTWYFKNYHE